METIVLGSSSRGLGVVVAFAVLVAVCGVFSLTGAAFGVVGGIVLIALAVVGLTVGLVGLRKPKPLPRNAYLFRGGVVLGHDGVLDPYAWPDLELTESRVRASNARPDHPERWTTLVRVGTPGGEADFIVPSGRVKAVAALARAGGATMFGHRARVDP
ncbi:hypothetical protein ACFFQW_15430 [Umezawaea endophytica]|uniref:Uncharacterized protein n=1 Tax=Umezawaea endophytica TaxID=1654476 RepID=A0A9X2VF24_9PSEU|nr:hypothetical protein [Umezawaea endophytica]MCS7475436.1 hypothetical protein [Umezawaea endophytica]